MPDTAEQKYWVGFDLGGTKMMAVVFDAQLRRWAASGGRRRGTKGRRSGKERHHLHDSRCVGRSQPGRGPAGRHRHWLSGLVDLDKGVILDSANLGWKNVRLQQELEEEFSCPVAVLNDVDAGVYGEYRFGAGHRARGAWSACFPARALAAAASIKGKFFAAKTSPASRSATCR